MFRVVRGAKRKVGVQPKPGAPGVVDINVTFAWDFKKRIVDTNELATLVSDTDQVSAIDIAIWMMRHPVHRRVAISTPKATTEF